MLHGIISLLKEYLITAPHRAGPHDQQHTDRHDYKQIPPKVDYTLTPKGKTLLPIIDQMLAWGVEDMKRTGEISPDWDPNAYVETLFSAPRRAG